jgi:acyl-CoA hydrolase
MDLSRLPPFFSACVSSHEEALQRIVKSGIMIGSGFGPSEPSPFYRRLWDHIRANDITDLRVRQALFMAPHCLCVGGALGATGLGELGGRLSKLPVVGPAAKSADLAVRKLDGLRRLMEHYRELKQRRIQFISPFIGQVSNIVVPDNRITRLLYPEYVGRNASRMGLLDMQSVHFHDGADALAFHPDGRTKVDAFALVMTPPNEQGELSHGPANGGNGDILDHILANRDADLLLYLNAGYPFTRGWSDARNTVNIAEFEPLAKAGRLCVVIDDSPVPALPKGCFDNVAPAESVIAEHVVNHIETHLALTAGRALQVGIGVTGVLAIRALGRSSWRGRGYSEMLEPFTLELFESGRIEGSHFVRRDGRRASLDGKIVCTFAMGEEGGDFYRKLDRHTGVVIAPSSRVVIPEAFYGGLGINNCLSIDFQGHVNSTGRDRNHHSGIGGAATIHRGLARGGVGYMCMKSTHRTPEGALRSSIFPYLPQGTPISHIGPDVMGGREGARFFLVTEHGVAQVSGCTQSEFIRAIISVSDPHFRDGLKREAWKEFRVN